MDRGLTIMIVGAGPGEERRMAELIHRAMARREAELLVAVANREVLIHEKAHAVFRLRDYLDRIDVCMVEPEMPLREFLYDPERRWVAIPTPRRASQRVHAPRSYRKQHR